MKVSLVMFSPKGERREFKVPGPKAIIGRTGDCDLQIQLGIISRRHCELEVEGETLTVRDLGSSNGTFVNGERVQLQVLKAGDQVAVGPVIFTVVLDGMPAEIAVVKTVLNGQKKLKKKKEGTSLGALMGSSPGATGPRPTPKPTNPADSGSIDLAGNSGLDILEDDDEEDTANNPLAALEALSKQRKG